MSSDPPRKRRRIHFNHGYRNAFEKRCCGSSMAGRHRGESSGATTRFDRSFRQTHDALSHHINSFRAWYTRPQRNTNYGGLSHYDFGNLLYQTSHFPETSSPNENTVLEMLYLSKGVDLPGNGQKYVNKTQLMCSVPSPTTINPVDSTAQCSDDSLPDCDMETSDDIEDEEHWDTHVGRYPIFDVSDDGLYLRDLIPGTLIPAYEACALYKAELVHESKMLQSLDLAESKIIGIKRWRKEVRDAIISQKCPNLTKTQIATLDSIDALDQLFPVKDEVYALYIRDFKDQIKNELRKFFDDYHWYLHKSLNKATKQSKRRLILGYVRYLRTLNVFYGEDEHWLDEAIYINVLCEMIKHFKNDSKFIIYVFHHLCRTECKILLTLDKFSPEHFEFFLRHAFRIKYNFWNMYHPPGRFFFPHYELDRGSRTTSRNSGELTEIFIRYGFPYDFTSKLLRCLCEYEDREWRRCYGQYWTPPLYYKNEDPVKLMVQMDGVHRIRFRLQSAGTHWRQFVWQVYLFCVDHFTGLPSRIHFQPVLRAWVRAMPEPFVTPDQIYENVRPLVPSQLYPKLERICEHIKNNKPFEEISDDYSPRSLQHLTRCSIRRRLKQNYGLGDGIDKLFLPTRMKDYLRLKS